jgi:hypothetical protein
MPIRSPASIGGDLHSIGRHRKITAWQNNANRKVRAQADYQRLTTVIWHYGRSTLSSLRIAGVPQQIFDEFFISCRPENASERSPEPRKQSLAMQTAPVGLYLRTRIPPSLIAVPHRLVRCSPEVNPRQPD